MDKFTVNLLRSMCRRLGIPTTGVKDDLIRRVAVEIAPDVCDNSSSEPEPEPEPEPDPEPNPEPEPDDCQRCCVNPICCAPKENTMNKIQHQRVVKKSSFSNLEVLGASWIKKIKSVFANIPATTYMMSISTICTVFGLIVSIYRLLYNEKFIVNITKK